MNYFENAKITPRTDYESALIIPMEIPEDRVARLQDEVERAIGSLFQTQEHRVKVIPPSSIRGSELVVFGPIRATDATALRNALTIAIDAALSEDPADEWLEEFKR